MELIISENFDIKNMKQLFHSNNYTKIIFNESEFNFSKIEKLGSYFFQQNPNIKIYLNTIGYNLSNLINQNWIYKIYINRIHYLEYLNDKFYNKFLAGFDDIFLFNDKNKIIFKLHLSEKGIYQTKDIEYFLQLSLMIKIFDVIIINNNYNFNFSDKVIYYKDNQYIYRNKNISDNLIFFNII